jgi:hypothetical protein
LEKLAQYPLVAASILPAAQATKPNPRNDFAFASTTRLEAG